MLRLVGLAGIAFAGQLQAQATIDGWKIVERTTADSEGVPMRMPVISRVYITDHQVRWERAQEKFQNLDPKVDFAVRITDDTAHTTTLFIASQRRASVSKTAPPTSRTSDDPTSRFLAGPVMTMHDLGPGGSIAGHPTRKYRITLSYVANTTLDGRPCQRTSNSVEEIWAASDILNEPHFRGILTDVPNPVIEHGPVGDSLASLFLHRDRFINGVVLRSIVSRKRPDATGTVRTTTVTMEVTELSQGPLARSLFRVPEGFATSTRRTAPVLRTAAESAEFAKIRTATDASIRASMRRALCDP